MTSDQSNGIGRDARRDPGCDPYRLGELDPADKRLLIDLDDGEGR